MKKFFWMCTTVFFFLQGLVVYADVSSAGCLIRSDEKIILVRDVWSRKYSLPGGGREKDEALAKVAQRETLEETGLMVEPRRLLITLQNRFAIFECVSQRTIELQGSHVSFPDSARNEITEVLLVEPQQIEPSKWRFPQQRNDVINFARQIASSQAQTLPPVALSWLSAKEIQLNVWVQKIKSPLLTNLNKKVFSALAEELMFLVILTFAWNFFAPAVAWNTTLLFYVTLLLTGDLKDLFHVLRPLEVMPSLQLTTASGYSFPSGHALAAAVIWGRFFVLMKYLGVKRINRVFTLCIVSSILVMFSRIYLGAHYFTDVVAGGVLGLLLVWLCSWLEGQTGRKKRQRPQRVPDAAFFVVLGYGLLSLGFNFGPAPLKSTVMLLATSLGYIWRRKASIETIRGSHLLLIRFLVAMLGVFVCSWMVQYVLTDFTFPKIATAMVASYFCIGLWISYFVQRWPFQKKHSPQF